MTIDDRIAPFFRMFAGMGIDVELTRELCHEYAMYEAEGRKRRPFLQDDVTDTVKEMIIDTIQRLEHGECRFIPDEQINIGAIARWNDAYVRAMTLFQAKVKGIFAQLAGRAAGAYSQHYVRSEGEKFKTLLDHLTEHGRLFDQNAVGEARALQRDTTLEAHIMSQQTDMVVALRTTPMTAKVAFDGMIVRAKSPERLARKIAQNWIDIWAGYDTIKRRNHGTVRPADLQVSYKDFLITDQFAFLLLFGAEAPFNYQFIFSDQMGFRQLEMRDASTLRIKPEATTRLERMKLVYQHDGLIFDLHVDDLASFIAMQYGETSHSRMVHQQHVQALNGPYCRSYRRIYEAARRFFLACDMPSVKPKLFELYTAERQERRKALTSMRERVLQRIDYRVDALERLATMLQPDPSLQRRKDEARIRENKEKLNREFRRRFGDTRWGAIRQELEKPLYETIVGHAYALEDVLREGIPAVFLHDTLSAEIRHQAKELLQHTESLTRLYGFLYDGSPQAGYLERERRFIEDVIGDIRFLQEQQASVFETLQDANTSLQDHGYTPARTDREYRRVLEAFEQTNRAIAETETPETPYNMIASLKLDVRILLASRVIELQADVLRQLERRRGEGKDAEMDGDMLQLFTSFRHRVDSIAYGCMERLSEGVREAYLTRRERFDKLAGLDRQL